VQAVDETGAVRDTPIAGEHPLTLYVDKHELVTLMTLGAAPEALAIGYLRNQRLVERIEDIVAVQVDWDVSAVVVKTRDGLADLEAKTQKRTTTSGCGQGTVSAISWPRSKACGSPAMRRSRGRRCTRSSIACGCTRRSTSRRAPSTAARLPPTSPRARRS
jgi:formate dehydrogenase assembly factor FdhD